MFLSDRLYRHDYYKSRLALVLFLFYPFIYLLLFATQLACQMSIKSVLIKNTENTKPFVKLVDLISMIRLLKNTKLK